MNRKITKTIRVRGVPIGGGNPIPVQSMTNTHTDDVAATLAQLRRLEAAGCEIVRLAVPNQLAARALPDIRRGTDLPLVADIHFDYRLALAAVEAGFDKIRINPGNIGSPERVRMVADACRERGVPIRVGVNSGSVEKGLLEKYGLCAKSLCESALGHVKLLEDCGFEDICISVKASDVAMTVEANRLLSTLCDYPLHIGVTEAGTKERGILKSAAGIGALLLDGIGDTIRISLTDAPEEEAHAGAELFVLALALLGTLLHIEDAHHAGKVDALVGQLVDELQALDIGTRIQTRVAARALGVHQALGLVDAQSLRMHAGQLGRHADHVQRFIPIVLGHAT